jgi:hypothetical protein
VARVVDVDGGALTVTVTDVDGNVGHVEVDAAP